MRSTRWRLIGASSALLAAFLLLQLPTDAQTPGKAAAPKGSVPRQPDGHPDLQGTWTNFDSTPLETASPDDTARLIPLEETFPGISKPGRKLEGPNPSAEFIDTNVIRPPKRRSLIVDPPDGRAPVRPEALQVRANNLAHLTDSWEFQTPWERCITRGVPGGMLPAGYNNGYQIFQTSAYVAIVYEMLHEPRIIPLDGRSHVDASIHQWNGDSRGRWDGDTLVVDITNYRAANSGTIATGISTTATLKSIPQSEAMHVTERFTRIDANTIKYEATVDDPNVYTRPWTVTMSLNRADDYRVLEYACHEGNYGLPNSLSGARAQEKKKAPK